MDTTLFTSLHQCHLPPDQFAIAGSGPLAVRGIRQAADIDIIVTRQLYQQLKDTRWTEHTWADSGNHYLTHLNIEADPIWRANDYIPNINQLISTAEIIEGLPFVKLEEIVRWKMAMNRPKDQQDILLIQKFLRSKL